MQYKFFTIPVMDDSSGSAIADEMNAFIRGHRVLTVQRELVNSGPLSCWCCCVEYIEGAKPSETGRTTREKTDYRAILNDEDFARFRILRECRKALADEEAVPAYAVFLDEHLAEFAKLSTLTEAQLKTVNGVGEKKVEKYGKRFVELWEKKRNETEGQSVPGNS